MAQAAEARGGFDALTHRPAVAVSEDLRGRAPDSSLPARCAPDRFPHSTLFTRIKPSPGRGVGVFAIRDIPHGTDPFLGDRSETVEVPVECVNGIDDPEMRRMYVDFCPVVDGCFIAPRDFNQMAQSWYLNHSERPNVLCGPDMKFRAKVAIERGRELTVDYRTFSDHAVRFIGDCPVPFATTDGS